MGLCKVPLQTRQIEVLIISAGFRGTDTRKRYQCQDSRQLLVRVGEQACLCFGLCLSFFLESWPALVFSKDRRLRK